MQLNGMRRNDDAMKCDARPLKYISIGGDLLKNKSRLE
jgi:hypothetical protein